MARAAARPVRVVASERARTWNDALFTEMAVAAEALEERYLRKKKLLHRRAATAELAADVRENVIGVGVGERITNNQPQGELCITVYVRRKLRPNRLGARQMIPGRFRGFLVDVAELGDMQPAQFAPANTVLLPSQVVRPIQPGCSVGVVGTGGRAIAGTLGAVVRNAGGVFLLSNNHVLADEDRVPVGTPVFQPSPDDAAAAVPVGTLASAVPLSLSVPNLVDAAIAAVVNGTAARADIVGLRAPTTAVQPTLNMQVEKFGRSTNYSAGVIANPQISIQLPYQIGVLKFRQQFVIRGNMLSEFAKGGDSGALVLQRGTSSAVGLLHSCNGIYAIASPISPVLGACGVTFA